MLLVKEVFRSLQGEGPMVGVPAVFVRLGTCNLRCPWCDTDFITDLRTVDEEKLILEIESLLPPNKFVVLTGGEPLLQNLKLLVTLLLDRGIKVQVETNGTCWQEWLEWPTMSSISLICSPKLGHPIDPRIPAVADACKVVYGVGAELPESIFEPAFVQPRDDREPEANRRNVEASVTLCMERGWRLSLQTHKLLGLR